MITVTFYSYKGGVGRSMAMANVAELLAQSGRKVVMCDWDFEAPGLERFAVDEASEAQLLLSCPGVIDLLVEYKKMLAAPNARIGEDGKSAERDFVRVENLTLRRPTSHAVHLRSYGSGWLKLLTAGRRDGANEGRYAALIQDFDWNDFYENWAGASYLEFFRRELAESGAEVVLIDSRTGVTEHGGVCTHHLADVVVLLCSASDQNLLGTKWMAEGLARPELKERRGGRGLEILVAPSRIDQRAQVDELGEFRGRFRDLFGASAAAVSISEASLEQTEIPYLAKYSFRERVIARANETEQKGAEGLLAAYRSLAKVVEERIPGAVAKTPSDTAAQMPPPTPDSLPSESDARTKPLATLRDLLTALNRRLRSLAHPEVQLAEVALAHALARHRSTQQWLFFLVPVVVIAVSMAIVLGLALTSKAADANAAALRLQDEIERWKSDASQAKAQVEKAQKDASTALDLSKKAEANLSSQLEECRGKLSDAPKDVVACRSSLELARGQAAQWQRSASVCEHRADECVTTLGAALKTSSLLNECTRDLGACMLKRSTLESDLARCQAVCK